MFKITILQAYSKISKYGYLLLEIAMTLPCLAKPMPLLTFDDYVTKIYEQQHFTLEQDFETIREALQEAYVAPLDLNKITPLELESLGILSISQLNSFFKHIATTGPLYSKYELQAIPDFDLETIALLLPFVYVKESYDTATYSLGEKITRGHYRFWVRYDPSWLVPPIRPLKHKKPSYVPLGNLDKWVTQCLLQYPNLMISVTGRKQAGEAFCLDHATHRYGFNLWSFSLLLHDYKHVKCFAIGDYQVGYGQGLLLNAGYIVPKGSDIVAVMRASNMGIRPYTAIQRNGLRGVAVTTAIGRIVLTGLYASHHLDAAIKWDPYHQPYVCYIDNRGKYDTIAHLQKKGTLHEQVVGCTLRLPRDDQTEIGINLLYHCYDIPIIPKACYGSRSIFQGKQIAAVSLFHRLLWKNILWFGEGGYAFLDTTLQKDSIESALITGLILSISRYIDLAALCYYYGEGFYAPYGKPFKYYTTRQGNEKGIYGTIQWTPYVNWQLAIHGHCFATLYPKPQLKTASQGYTITTRANYIWDRSTTCRVQHQFHQIPKNKQMQDATMVGKVVMAHKHYLKCKLDHQCTHNWWTAAEAQYIYHTLMGVSSPGYAVAVVQKWRNHKLKISCKSIYFQTDSYASRLYVHTLAPLYSGMLFSPHYGHGLALHCLVGWKCTPWLCMDLKYGFVYMLKDLCLQKQHVGPTGLGKQQGTLQVMVHF